MKYLFLENQNGKVIRTFLCDQASLFAVKIIETGRLELWTAEALNANKHISLKVLSFIPEMIPEEGFLIPSIGVFKQARYLKKSQYNIKTDLQYPSLERSSFYFGIYVLTFFVFCFIGLILKTPVGIQKVEEELLVSIQPNKVEAEVKTLFIERLNRNFGKKTVNIKKNNVPLKLKNVSDKFLAVKNNTQKLKISLGSVFSSDDKSLDTLKRPQNEIKQEIYDKSVFSASKVSGKLESMGGNVKIERENTYGKIALLSEDSISKGKQVGSKRGGLTIEQERALDEFMLKEEGVLRLCYERGLQIFPGFRGDIYLSWRIDNKGKARSIRVVKLGMNKNSDIDLNEFKECIVDRIKLWSFPLILSQEVIPYTFQFSPSAFHSK